MPTLRAKPCDQAHPNGNRFTNVRIESTIRQMIASDPDDGVCISVRFLVCAYQFGATTDSYFWQITGPRARCLEPFVTASTIMSVPTSDNLDSYILRSVVEHVFMPPKLPQKHPGEETERKTNVALCNNLIEAARDFLQIIPSSESPVWMSMITMMELARRAANAPFKKVDLQRALSAMALGGTYRVPPLWSTLIRRFSIRRILHAYSGTKRCSHCAQACHCRLRSVRGVRSLATDPRCNGGRGKAVVLIPRTCNPNPRRYFYGRMLSPGAVFLPCSNGC